ncbi:hypothetical protein J6590_057583 [Homalodisca vitripennis]|nr:hypothetical protein J6590_057583 [Homalodisca vitripennis]
MKSSLAVAWKKSVGIYFGGSNFSKPALERVSECQRTRIFPGRKRVGEFYYIIHKLMFSKLQVQPRNVLPDKPRTSYIIF